MTSVVPGISFKQKLEPGCELVRSITGELKINTRRSLIAVGRFVLEVRA